MELNLDINEKARELKNDGFTTFTVEGSINEAVVQVEKNGDIIKGVIAINLDANVDSMDEIIFAGQENIVGIAAQGVVNIIEDGWNKSPDLEATQSVLAKGREAEYEFRYQV